MTTDKFMEEILNLTLEVAINGNIIVVSGGLESGYDITIDITKYGYVVNDNSVEYEDIFENILKVVGKYTRTPINERGSFDSRDFFKKHGYIDLVSLTNDWEFEFDDLIKLTDVIEFEQCSEEYNIGDVTEDGYKVYTDIYGGRMGYKINKKDNEVEDKMDKTNNRDWITYRFDNLNKVTNMYVDCFTEVISTDKFVEQMIKSNGNNEITEDYILIRDDLDIVAKVYINEQRLDVVNEDVVNWLRYEIPCDDGLYFDRLDIFGYLHTPIERRGKFTSKDFILNTKDSVWILHEILNSDNDILGWRDYMSDRFEFHDDITLKDFITRDLGFSSIDKTTVEKNIKCFIEMYEDMGYKEFRTHDDVVMVVRV